MNKFTDEVTFPPQQAPSFPKTDLILNVLQLLQKGTWGKSERNVEAREIITKDGDGQTPRTHWSVSLAHLLSSRPERVSKGSTQGVTSKVVFWLLHTCTNLCTCTYEHVHTHTHRKMKLTWHPSQSQNMTRGKGNSFNLPFANSADLKGPQTKSCFQINATKTGMVSDCSPQGYLSCFLPYFELGFGT